MTKKLRLKTKPSTPKRIQKGETVKQRIQITKIKKNNVSAKNVIFLNAGIVPPQLAEIQPENLFEALIYPLTKDIFLKTIFHKKALVIRANPLQDRRVHVRKALFNLNLLKMLSNTASDTLHIWQPTKTTINSFSTDDPNQAFTAYTSKKASLYFGSSLKMRELWCKQLTYQMGYGFSGYFSGTTSATVNNVGDTTGEIETFVSRDGNYTDWHMDFQENFTIQVKGSKRWRLCVEKGMEAPLVGYTPHFQNAGNLEIQDKVHQAYQGVNISRCYESQERSRQCTEVVMNEGDILYHPAGIWHSVQAVGDSISINFSLRHIRPAELVTNALTMLLLKEPSLRKPFHVTDLNSMRQQVNSALKLAAEKLKEITSDMIVPPKSLLIPRQIQVNLDEPSQSIVKPGMRSLKRNPFFTLTDLAKVPQSDKKGFLVNGLFGNTDHESITQICLTTKDKQNQLFLRNLPENVTSRSCTKQLRQHLFDQGLYY